MPDPRAEHQWVAIAWIVSPRGNRGEVAAAPLTNRLERFESLKEVFLFGPGGPLNNCLPFEVESVWLHRGRVIFKFRGFETISEAERLRDAEVRLPISERVPVEEGEYYQSDLTGCRVIEGATGELVGHVASWQDSGGPGLLDVRGPDNEEILIPFATSICKEIDVKARRIVVNLPEGLKDLNRK